MGGNIKDGSADAGGGDGVLWNYFRCRKKHSIHVGLHKQIFFHVRC